MQSCFPILILFEDILQESQILTYMSGTKQNQNQGKTKHPSVFYLHNVSGLSVKKQKGTYIGYKTKTNEKMLLMKEHCGKILVWKDLFGLIKGHI